MSNGTTPPNKFTTALPISNLTSDQALAAVNAAVDKGHYNTFLPVTCTDGEFVLLGYYKS